MSRPVTSSLCKPISYVQLLFTVAPLSFALDGFDGTPRTVTSDKGCSDLYPLVLTLPLTLPISAVKFMSKDGLCRLIPSSMIASPVADFVAEDKDHRASTASLLLCTRALSAKATRFHHARYER